MKDKISIMKDFQESKIKRTFLCIAHHDGRTDIGYRIDRYYDKHCQKPLVLRSVGPALQQREQDQRDCCGQSCCVKSNMKSILKWQNLTSVNCSLLLNGPEKPFPDTKLA